MELIQCNFRYSLENKVSVIKAIRYLSGYVLKDVKDLVDMMFNREPRTITHVVPILTRKTQLSNYLTDCAMEAGNNGMRAHTSVFDCKYYVEPLLIDLTRESTVAQNLIQKL